MDLKILHYKFPLNKIEAKMVNVETKRDIQVKNAVYYRKVDSQWILKKILGQCT